MIEAGSLGSAADCRTDAALALFGEPCIDAEKLLLPSMCLRGISISAPDHASLRCHSSSIDFDWHSEDQILRRTLIEGLT